MSSSRFSFRLSLSLFRALLRHAKYQRLGILHYDDRFQCYCCCKLLLLSFTQSSLSLNCCSVAAQCACTFSHSRCQTDFTFGDLPSPREEQPCMSRHWYFWFFIVMPHGWLALFHFSFLPIYFHRNQQHRHTHTHERWLQNFSHYHFHILFAFYHFRKSNCIIIWCTEHHEWKDNPFTFRFALCLRVFESVSVQVAYRVLVFKSGTQL